MEKNRRQIKNLIINHDTQIRYGVLFLSFAVLAHVVLAILGINLYISWATRAEDSSGGNLTLIFCLMIFFYILFYAGALGVGIIMTHKIYGPFVNIKRVLEKFVEGDYSSRIRLRKGDDTKVIELANLIELVPVSVRV